MCLLLSKSMALEPSTDVDVRMSLRYLRGRTFHKNSANFVPETGADFARICFSSLFRVPKNPPPP